MPGSSPLPPNVRLLGGSFHPDLVNRVAANLDRPLVKCKVGQFANGETRVEILECCRGCQCFIIQPLCNSENGQMSVNDALMEVLIMVSALRSASAKTITAVLPIYGYARQDKKDHTRASITARLVADLLEKAGIDRAITVDLHASQIQGFFQKPFEDIEAFWLLVNHIRTKFNARFRPVPKKNLAAPATVTIGESALTQPVDFRQQLVVVAPDAGGAKRATKVAANLGLDCAIISKERLEANKVSSMRMIGDVKGKIAILLDDIADTCGTLCMAATEIMKFGATEVHAYITHGIFSGPALARLNECPAIFSVVTTNTLPQKTNMSKCSKIEVLDVAPLLADTISFVCNEQSLEKNLSWAKL